MAVQEAQRFNRRFCEIKKTDGKRENERVKNKPPLDARNVRRMCVCVCKCSNMASEHDDENELTLTALSATHSFSSRGQTSPPFSHRSSWTRAGLTLFIISLI